VRILYRASQFWRSVALKTDVDDLEQAQAQLSHEQWELFKRLQPAERAHAIMVFRKLLQRGENQPDLLTAALLHDIGKLQYRLNPFQRAMVVVASALMPRHARHWGILPTHGWEALPGWRKAFIVAEQHAAWGAEMARQAGVSPMVEALIRQHHLPHRKEEGNIEDNLLHILWVVDNDS
jgi:putative nucleotidyltransferase with HDIG domain